MARTTTTDIITNLATGKGSFRSFYGGAGTNSTAPSATSGHIRLGMNVNAMGTTYPGTLVGFPGPDSTTQSLFIQANWMAVAATPAMFGRFYKLGTLDLTATGDKFTHDSTFTSLQRTVLGAANTPIAMIPLIYVTTALTTTAAQVIFKTAAGGTGYVDQDGNNTVGTKTFVFPSATTAAGSIYLPMVETGDCGVQDVVAIQVTTSAATGACTIYGFEPYFNNVGLYTYHLTQNEGIYSGAIMNDMEPASPSSGSVTSHLGTLSFAGGTANTGFFITVNN